MKPTFQIDKPKEFRYLAEKPKRQQMLEERYTEIERENRILLEKMTSILQTRGSATAPDATVSTIQNSVSQQIPSNILPPINKKSLNREARKRELMKITQENQLILKRL